MEVRIVILTFFVSKWVLKNFKVVEVNKIDFRPWLLLAWWFADRGVYVPNLLIFKLFSLAPLDPIRMAKLFLKIHIHGIVPQTCCSLKLHAMLDFHIKTSLLIQTRLTVMIRQLKKIIWLLRTSLNNILNSNAKISMSLLKVTEGFVKNVTVKFTFIFRFMDQLWPVDWFKESKVVICKTSILLEWELEMVYF